jgi:hypothetical protein
MTKQSFLILFLFGFSCSMQAQGWDQAGSSITNKVYELQIYNGNLYQAGPSNNMLWNGTDWEVIATPPNGFTSQTVEVFNGELYLSGTFTSGSPNKVAKYDGVNWVRIGGDFAGAPSSFAQIQVLYSDSNYLYAGGKFVSAGANLANNICYWDGSEWLPMGDGFNDIVLDIMEFQGDIYATGGFTASGLDTTVKNIARWDGTSWNPIIDSVELNYAYRMEVFGSDLIIGGIIGEIQGQEHFGASSWDGT